MNDGAHAPDLGPTMLQQRMMHALDAEITQLNQRERKRYSMPKVAAIEDPGHKRRLRERGIPIDDYDNAYEARGIGRALGAGVGEDTRCVITATYDNDEQDTVSGRIVHVSRAGTVHFVTEETLAKNAKLEMQVELTWMSRQLLKITSRLVSARRAGNAREDISLAEAVYCVPEPIDKREPLHPDEAALKNTNERQSEAVAASCSENALTYLWGPPGTGKTSTQASIVQNQAAQGKTVLVTAPTHQAVRQLIGAIMRRDPELKPLYWRGRKARPARPVSALRRARVVAATTAQIAADIDKIPQFDAVVVDEASMVSIPMLAAVASRARERLVIGGDPMQLGTITQVEEQTAQETLTQSVFDAHNVRALHEYNDARVAYLDQQYRMVEPIMEVCNDMTYRGRFRLKDAGNPKPAAVQITGIDSDAHVLLVDTGPLQLRSRRPLGGASSYNTGTACLIAGLIESMPAEERSKVGVVTPFRSHIELVKVGCAEAGQGGALPNCHTVHSFQGSESNTIILDLVEGNSPYLSKYARSERPDDEGGKLFNVAVTRAKSRLVVLADVRALRHRAPEGGTVNRLLDTLEANGQVLSASTLMETQRYVGPMRGTAKVRIGTNAAEDRQVLFDDIDNAKDSIIVYDRGGDISRSEANRSVATLDRAVARGVEVTVRGPVRWPRGVCDHWEQNDGTTPTLDTVNLVPCEEQRTQAVVIDAKLAWEGGTSLRSRPRATDGNAIRIHDSALVPEIAGRARGDVDEARRRKRTQEARREQARLRREQANALGSLSWIE